jgi:phospholipid-binding lipoprotein MlaA
MQAVYKAGWLARARNAALATALALSAGCATVNGGNGEINDPLENINRVVYSFNDAFDTAIFKPIATAYKEVVPDPVRDWVRNFFANIDDLMIGFNNLLQGKPLDAATDWMRFAVNTIFGFAGINDFASAMGLEKHDEDFGQTFGRWGMDYGAYIVWPFTGSSSIRDSLGGIFNWSTDPVWQYRPKHDRNIAFVIRAVSRRADLLVASTILEEAALDKYLFNRDAYLARRRDLIYDGKPPREQRQAPSGQLPVAPASADAAARLLEEPAVNPAGAPRVGSGYEPRVPGNYDAVLAASSPGE